MGIDLGTSSVRAGIFHEEGKQIAVGTRTYPIQTPSPGCAEQDPYVWWKCACEAIQEVLHTAKVTGSDITGISFSGQMHGGVLLDRDGDPVAPAIIWADSRSVEECREITGILGEERLKRILMNRIFPGTQAAILLWLRKNEPKLLQRIRRVLLPKDYLRFRMCGLYNTEPSDASSTLLFDIGMREWSEDILKALDIPLDYLPYVVNSDEHIGETAGIEDVTGLPDGIPVIMGGADQPCTALGNGVLDKGTVLVTIGTGGQIHAPVSSPLTSPELSLNTFCHLPESRWYVMGATLSAGLSLRWFRDTFAPGTGFDILTREAEEVLVGAEGLLFTPYLTGKRSPVFEPLASGNFSGIRLTHTRGHFVRAIMEGVLFELKVSLDVMTKMGLTPETITFSGGASKSSLWAQIMADVFNLPIRISDQDEQACFGAALLAGIGTGVYKDYWKAAEMVRKPERTVEQDKENVRRYEDQFERFKTIS